MQIGLTDLKQRIKSQIPHLTESQKAIANYIVENPQRFALSSVRELEKELKTSKSTIVRLAQTLGYNGFYELKNVFLKTIRHKLDPINRYKSYLFEPGEKSNYLKLVTEETIKNINSTMPLIDDEQYKKTIELIKNANHVYTIGLGISNYLAELASYLLNRVSINSTFMMHGGLTFAEQIINVSKNDLILAFCFPPYSDETVQAASYAQEKKIKVISITDKATSEIVPYSDAFLQVVVESVTISNSVIAALVLLYSIATQIGYELKNKTLETLESIQHVRKEHSGKKIKNNT